MELSRRLRRLCELADSGNTVADIGCDHAYVSIELVKSGKFKSAIAMDINEGPLEIAADNIKASGLGDRITTRLSNGARKLIDNEADSLVIAGMGGQLIINILQSDIERLKSVNQLILGPQSENYLLRQFLRETDFVIDKEDMVFDADKYYQLIHAVRKAKKVEENIVGEKVVDEEPYVEIPFEEMPFEEKLDAEMSSDDVDLDSEVSKSFHQVSDEEFEAEWLERYCIEINNFIDLHKKDSSNTVEDNKLYQDLECTSTDLREIFDIYGEYLVCHKHSALRDYIVHEYKLQTDILEGLIKRNLEGNASEKVLNRIEEIKSTLRLNRIARIIIERMPI